MAIALDSSPAAVTGAGNLSWTHTCTGSELALFVLGETGTTATAPSSITYNGVNLTRLAHRDGVALGSVELWGLLNPTTGSNTVTVTKGTSSSRFQSASYTGVKQSGLPDATQVGDVTLAAAGNATVALSVVAGGCWVISTNEDTLINPDAGVVTTTLRGGETTYGSGRVADSNGTVSTGSINVGYHYTGANSTTIVCASFAPSVPIKNLTLLGVG